MHKNSNREEEGIGQEENTRLKNHSGQRAMQVLKQKLTLSPGWKKKRTHLFEDLLEFQSNKDVIEDLVCDYRILNARSDFCEQPDSSIRLSQHS